MNSLPEFLQPLQYETRPFPFEAMAEAIDRRDESIPHLLHALEWADEHVAEANASERPYMLHIFALYLLAQFRETRAHPLVIRLLCNPRCEELTGDMITEDFSRILASTCGGDIAPVRAMIEDEELDESVRVAALVSLAVLAHSVAESRNEISAYFGELFRHRLTREPSFVWDMLIATCVDLGMAGHLEEIRQLFKDGVADPKIDRLEDIEAEFAEPGGRVRWDGYSFVDDAIAEMENWDCFDPGLSKEELEEPAIRWDPSVDGWGTESLTENDPAVGPVIRTEPKIGRNELCPCGSGKKYKKCCGSP